MEATSYSCIESGLPASGYVVDNNILTTTEATDTPLVLAVVEDLFFGTKIADAAKRAGGKIIFATTPEAMWQRIQSKPALVVFDLTFDRMQPLDVLRTMQADSQYEGLKTLGFLPHVREDLKQAAIGAGCGTVLPRSVFSLRMNEVLQKALQTNVHPEG